MRLSTCKLPGDLANLRGSAPTAPGTYLRPNLIADPFAAGPVAANPDPACQKTISQGGKAADAVRTIASWFNPCAFGIPSGSFGNLGRNVFRGKSVFNTDLSLFKSFPIRERLAVAVPNGGFQRLQYSELGHACEREPDVEHECYYACQQRRTYLDSCGRNKSASTPVWLKAEFLILNHKGTKAQKFIYLCLSVFVVAQSVVAQTWPHPIPARIRDGANRELMVMTLGDVKPSIADGTFDPVKDELRLKDGTVLKHYYRDTLKIKYFQPIDKTRFPLPPSGWCSWYFFYQEINENEIKITAKWIAENLKDFGAQYIQIDDGWQGTGRGLGENRDWSTINNRFPAGMDGLAAYIKSLGLKPGIWLAPHGQSNEAVVKNHAGVFLMKPDGTTASSTWEGTFLIDPSAPESHKYLKDLFAKLSSWGYEYFKIDGQPIVVREYRNKKSFMKNPADDTDGLYRETLKSIRAGIGPNSYLLGCWVVPLEGVGLMNGSRIGADVLPNWDGFKFAMRATMQYYFLHNVAWYADPDVFIVRAPLSLEQARAWATLQGLTGQAALMSDRLVDLSPERVELIKRVYPAVNIRPLDLFSSDRNKRIWDLES